MRLASAITIASVIVISIGGGCEAVGYHIFDGVDSRLMDI